MADWYSRPVFFVADVDIASAFYVDMLGFAESWRHKEADGPVLAAQVNREGCEIILSRQWPDKIGQGMLFISLTAEGWKALPDVWAARGAGVARGHWGYPVVIVDDPDGNQLYFPDPESPGS